MEPEFGVGVEFDGLHVDRYIDEGRSGSVWMVHEIAAPENVWAVKIHLGAYVKVRKSRFRREMKFVKRDYIRDNAFRITAEYMKKAKGSGRRQREASEANPAPHPAK